MLVRLLYSALFLTPWACGCPEVATSLGRLRGRVLRTRNGRDFFSFNRIPYAQPPLGNLRFMPPLPSTNWTGILDASQESPLCYQWDSKTSLPQGQEDCLYLSIYTPKITNVSFPVMIYIHGGGYIIGRTAPAEASKYFMDEDVVLITPSYRLGRLGFLSFEDEIIPGNMALKDVALALEWVKREIRAFGGNPDLITLFGNSAGSVSAHYLCSAPRTSGLVKGCISQSGVGGSPTWTLGRPGEARIAALALAEALGCSGNQLLSCLQSKAVEKVTDSSLIPPEKDMRPTPVVEPPSEHAIVTSWPSEKNNFPWIAGITADEGMFFTGYFEFINETYPHDKYMKHLRKNILEILQLETRPNDVQRILDRMTAGVDQIAAGRKFGTEALFLYPTLKAFSQHDGPKYFYVFNYTGGPSYFEVLHNKNFNVSGVCHHDDYPYFFYMPNKFTPEGWPGPKDVQLSQALIKIWVTFAREQSPSKAIPQWKNFRDRSYLSIGNDGLKLKKYKQYNDIVNFWKDMI